jgi:ADP-ribose pyrophosphatase YjhB (NUDIX family)
VLQRKPRYGKTLLPAGSIFPNEDPVDAAVRELFEKIDLTLTVDDLTLLSNNPRRVPLNVGKHKLVYIYVACVPIPHVTANLRTLATISQVVTSQSTTNPYGSYVVPSAIDIDGLTLAPSKHGLLHETQRKLEMLHFGYVAQREAFRGAVISEQLFAYDDTSLPRQLFFFTQFTAADYGPLWMLIKGYVNELCRETPTYLRMGIPPPTINFASLEVTLTHTQRKAAINAPYQSRQDARTLDKWLEMQPQRYVMLGINANSYNAVV